MPIYQYTCPKCNSQFELKQSFRDKPMATCPRCQNKARRLFVPTPIIFKGSGFYVTDHRKNGGTSASQPSKKAETKSSSEESEGSSEESKSSSEESKSSSEESKSSSEESKSTA